MNLLEAQVFSETFTAKLVIRDLADPCMLGTNTDFGVLYMWTYGHTIPMTTLGNLRDQPTVEQSMVCQCGALHAYSNNQGTALYFNHEVATAVEACENRGSFPKNHELLFRLMRDDRWEPIFEITEPLERLARVKWLP